MLLNLTIKNFAIVSFVEIDWQQGMTAITGETGAGKSIAIDALGLCLGARALANSVRPNCDKAELTAVFCLEQSRAAKDWLVKRDLQQDHECIVRRVINSEGRSKAYINSNPVPLAQLKELGQLLINIHGQHDHQLLMKNQEQKRLLDDYAGHQHMLSELKSWQRKWRNLKQELEQLTTSKQQRQAQQQLLQYQVKELDEFAISPGEFEQLESDYKRSANAQQLLLLSEQSLQQLNGEDHHSPISVLQQCRDDINELAILDPGATDIANLFNEALIQIQEASSDLGHYQQNIDIDPEAFSLIEERYSTAVQLARKHMIAPENLCQLHNELSLQLQAIAGDDSRLEHIEDELERCFSDYLHAAQQLSDSRKKAAIKLEKSITKAMQELNMPNGRFKLAIEHKQIEQPTLDGIDTVQFLISMNPGQEVEPLAKVASGGELSRISLAIQVILAEKVVTPTLIFDEVDVGISGPTAAKVGQQLQKLGNNTQVICVTHLPQVASCGDQQLFVAKLTDGKNTQTTVSKLDSAGREKEIARLLAGDEITKSSLANAKELLAS